jgi:hypothetical protein
MPRFVIVALGLLIAGRAFAFAEDVCYPGDGGLAQDCAPLPASCPLYEPMDGGVSANCFADVFAAFANQQGPDRSSVHSDATMVLAQAVGFSPNEAYWAAAYDETTDLGTYAPKDLHGRPVTDGGVISVGPTAQLDGLVRGDFDAGGVLFHFGAPRAADAGVDGLHPDPTNAQVENTLAHLRAWAWAGTGNTRPECVAGLTVQTAANDYATGTRCFVDAAGSSAPVRGSLTAVGSLAVPFSFVTGEQVIHTTDAGVMVPSSQFDSYLAYQHVADARLGIYLHALADRVSHHVCTDASLLTGPSASGFREDLNTSPCAQPLHLLRHMYETGVSFANENPLDQTTTAALEAAYDELVQFASRRGVLLSKARTSAYRSEVLTALGAALQKPKACARVTAIAKVACDRGWQPFPGTSCTERCQ